MGVKGCLLCWLKSFFSDCKATVRFQGHISEAHSHTNGMPQGNIINPTLFNSLIECLLHLNLGRGTHLLCYTDDITLITYGGNYYHKAQKTLDLIYRKCRELELKVNPHKTRALSIKIPTPTISFSLAHPQ